MSSRALIVGIAAGTHADEAETYLRNSPSDGDGAVTLLRSSRVALRATDADEPSPGVCEMVIPVPETTSAT